MRGREEQNRSRKSLGDKAIIWIIQNRCSYQRRAIMAEEQIVDVDFFMLTAKLSLEVL